jgi:basic membrane protein A
MKKKLMVLLLATVMIGSLTACGGSKKEAPDKESSVTSESNETTNEGGSTDFSASIVCDTGGVNDQSYNQSAWEGLQQFGQETGAKVSYLESSQATDYTTNFDKLSDEDLDLIWGNGYNVAEAFLNSANMNPDKTYAILDYDFGAETPENVACATFSVQDSSFLVGYIAGLTTETNRVGYIGGMKSPTMDFFEYGYRAGVDYAAKELGKEITVDIQYGESFSDAAKGKAMAASMYSSGSDIIFQAAGGLGVGVIEGAAEEDKWVIGVDRDQSYLAPENILTSALKTVGIATDELSKKMMDGEDIGGKTFAYGLKEGAVGIPDTNPNLDPAIYEKAMKLQEKMQAQEVIAPFDEAGYNSFNK